MGSLMSGIAGSNQANFQAGIDRLNQGLTNYSAQSALEKGGYQAGEAQMGGSQTIGAQKAAYAASGVDVGQGTPLSTMASTRMMSTADADMLKNNAAREAWGYELQGWQYGMQSKLDKMRANADLAGGVLGSITEAGSFAGKLK